MAGPCITSLRQASRLGFALLFTLMTRSFAEIAERHVHTSYRVDTSIASRNTGSLPLS